MHAAMSSHGAMMQNVLADHPCRSSHPCKMPMHHDTNHLAYMITCQPCSYFLSMRDQGLGPMHHAPNLVSAFASNRLLRSEIGGPAEQRRHRPMGQSGAGQKERFVSVVVYDPPIHKHYWLLGHLAVHSHNVCSCTTAVPTHTSRGPSHVRPHALLLSTLNAFLLVLLSGPPCPRRTRGLIVGPVALHRRLEANKRAAEVR